MIQLRPTPQMFDPVISTIVLAGGFSTRMGQDKALLEIQGVPLLRRITDLALAVSRKVLVVTAWPERYQAAVAPDCQFVTDRDSAGPLVGFAQGLTVVERDWVLLLSCDLPNLDQATIAGWINDLATVPAGAVAYLPQGEKGWEPLCGFYRSTCRESLRQFIDQGGRSFQRWLQTQSVAILPVVDRSVLANCNTPEDWRRIVDRYKSTVQF
jgi:molybdenum cofactor guanylyltransferase